MNFIVDYFCELSSNFTVEDMASFLTNFCFLWTTFSNQTFRLKKMPPKKKNVSKGKKLDTKTKKTASKQQKQTTKVPATKQSKKVPATKEYKPDHCGVVFSNGECELFKSEDEPRIQ